MVISIDVKQLQFHSDILQKELNAVEALLRYLNECWKLAHDANLSDDVIFWAKQLQIIQDQGKHIRDRILLLEQMADEFTRVKYEAKEHLDNAMSEIKLKNHFF